MIGVERKKEISIFQNIYFLGGRGANNLVTLRCDLHFAFLLFIFSNDLSLSSFSAFACLFLSL